MRAVIQLAHSLNLTVVAEGVETEGQRDMLELLGCDCLQGYLLGRPVPADAFEAMLEFMSTKQFLKEDGRGKASRMAHAARKSAATRSPKTTPSRSPI